MATPITPDTLHALGAISLVAWIRALITFVVGYLVAKLAAAKLDKVLRKHTSAQQAMLIRRVLFYTLFFLFLIAALQQIGFKMSVLLGAAGFLTVAIGFASQTSISNLIAALFLIAERPFVMGNIIKVGSFTGEVISIDALSIKLRTFDNTFVRVPNSKLLGIEIVNLSRFPTCRVTLKATLGDSKEIAAAHKLILNAIKKNSACLDSPEPDFKVLGFNQAAVNLQCLIWGKREDLGELSSTLQKEIAASCESKEISLSALTVDGDIFYSPTQSEK